MRPNKNQKTRYSRIHLTQGKIAIVDVEDRHLLEGYKWYCDKIGRNFYATVRRNGKTIRLHELILGKKAGYVIDHISGNSLDNRRKNLRHVLHFENLLNVSPRGYYFDKTKKIYICRIKCLGIVFRYGRFNKELNAIRCSKEFRRKIIAFMDIYKQKILATNYRGKI